MRLFLKSFIIALTACFLSLGTCLFSSYTLSARVTAPNVLRYDECLLGGKNWECHPRMNLPNLDGGAVALQETPLAYVFHDQNRSEPAAWNPYVGSGYPTFLDGIFRSVTPSRIFVSHFPTDQARDVLIFLRFLLWTWAFVLFFNALGLGATTQFFAAFFATMIPYPARFIDIVFLDVDMLAPLIFLYFFWGFQSQKEDKKMIIWRCVGVALGLYVGLQSFVQAQVTFSLIFGATSLIALYFLGKEALWALAAYSVGFLPVAVPNALNYLGYLREFVTNRNFVGCFAEVGVGAQKIWQTSYTGYFKYSDFYTVASLAGVLVLWPLWKKPIQRAFLVLYVGLVVWLAFGSPKFVCRVPGINGIGFNRHLLPYIQSLFYILGFWSAADFISKKKFKKTLWMFFFVTVIFPFAHGPLISVEHLRGNIAREVEFATEKIPNSNVYSVIQNLSISEDRRHFAPDGRLFPNFPAIFKILDLRVLYALFPEKVYRLNSELFQNWSYVPSPKTPDRFTGVSETATQIDLDLQRLLAMHHVSLLTFSKQKQWLPENGFYSLQTCQKLMEDDHTQAWSCPQGGRVGFFPKKVLVLGNQNLLIEKIKSMSPEELSVSAFLTDSEVSGSDIHMGAGTVEKVDRNLDSVTYDLNVDVPGLFVVSDTWFPGWNAKINGQPARILNANIGFKAVLVPEGKVHLELEFKPKNRIFTGEY